MRPLAIAVAFLTRLPVPTGATSPRELGRAVAWFPAVGAALGGLVVGVHALLAGRLAAPVVAVAVVAVLAGATGGLHLDGFADVFDALGGGRGSRDRMLAIMRDSRIGAHGAAALGLLLAAKLAAVAQAPAWALFAAPVVARWAVVPLIVGFPYVRPEGLGQAFHGHAGAAQLVGATAIAALALVGFGTPAVLCAGVGVAAALALAIWMDRRLGGLTGDVYGAAIELAELAFLVAAGV